MRVRGEGVGVGVGEGVGVTGAMLLQFAYLGVQAPQRVGVFLLQEEQVLLCTVQLHLQVGHGHRVIQAPTVKANHNNVRPQHALSLAILHNNAADSRTPKISGKTTLFKH